MEVVAEKVDCEAEYAIESAVQCAACKNMLETFKVIRLLRTKVNFTSTLPRRGYVVVCPRCSAVVTAVIGGRA